MNLGQLSGIIRYEFLMHWRRRALLSVMLGTAVVPLVIVLFFGESNVAEIRQTWITAGGVESEVVRQVTTRYAVTYASLTLYIILLLILPVVAADSVPKDRQWGVRELLDSLPHSATTYLLGKVLGFWAATIVGVTGAMLLSGLGLWLLLGPFQIEHYAAMWLILLIGVGLVNTGLSIVLAAGQATRRRAIFIGVTFAVVCMFANVSNFGRTGTLWAIANPGRQVITSYFFFETWIGDIDLSQLITTGDVALALLAGALELLLIGGVVALWLRRGSE